MTAESGQGERGWERVGRVEQVGRVRLVRLAGQSDGPTALRAKLSAFLTRPHGCRANGCSRIWIVRLTPATGVLLAIANGTPARKARMRYLVAWILGVPFGIIVLWYVVGHAACGR